MDAIIHVQRSLEFRYVLPYSYYASGRQLLTVFNRLGELDRIGFTFQVLDRFVDGEAYEVVDMATHATGFFRIVPILPANQQAESPLFKMSMNYGGVRIFLQPTESEAKMATQSHLNQLYLLRQLFDAFKPMLIAAAEADWQVPELAQG